jgi:hypothetical protein
MDTKLKLELLAKEYNATMAHAEEVLNEYIATAIEEAVMNAIDKLDDNQKMLLLIALLED